MSDHDARFSLRGRRALVGGATQGIGRACAMAFAGAGASVVLLGRNGAGLQKVLAELPTASGVSHSTVEADFADWKRVQSAVAGEVERGGPLHIVLHNTGGPPAGSAIEAAPEDFVRAFEMHLLTGQVIVQACAPGMRAANYGRIINITSTSVLTPIRGLGVSNTVRAAVANWAKTLAGELAPHGITVNTILPGSIQTSRLDAIFQGRANRGGLTIDEVRTAAIAQIPAGRLGDPSEIAAAALFLASPAGSYVTGVNLAVDGGRTAVQS